MLMTRWRSLMLLCEDWLADIKAARITVKNIA
jgi:hypothetical protein